MADYETKRTAGAILFVVAALGFLAFSVRRTTLADDTGGLVARADAKPAPDFTLADVHTGQRIELKTQASRTPVVFTFWATWCGPCRMELPHIEELSKEYGGRVAFYGVDSSDPPGLAAQFAAHYGYTFPILSDNALNAYNAYGISSLPTLFVVDRDGMIRYSNVGYGDDEPGDLKAVLDRLLAESG